MSWIQAAKPGDFVVCVNADEYYTPPAPVLGRVYTIRELFEVPWCFSEAGQIFFRPEELSLSIHRTTGIELAWDPADFEPTSETHKQIIQSLKAPSPVRVREAAE